MMTIAIAQQEKPEMVSPSHLHETTVESGIVAEGPADSTLVSRNPSLILEGLVFSSDAACDTWVWIVLAIAPLILLLIMIPNALNESVTSKDKRTGIIIHVACALLVCILYLAILPKRFEVHAVPTSHGILKVVTYLVTWKFQQLRHAQVVPGLFSCDCRPKIDFATSSQSRVVVYRRLGKWEVTVSPKDPSGLIQAILSVCNNDEAI